MKINKFAALISITGVMLLTACDEHAPLRDNENAQNTALTQLKYQEMAPAEGTFTGQVYIKSSKLHYDCVLEIKRVMTIQSSGDQPTETIEIPRLSATLTFQFLASLSTADFAKYEDLRDPMGGNNNVVVTTGDYNPNADNLVDLPYNVPNNANSQFGEIRLNLSNGHLTGGWTAQSIGDVGTFDLTKTN